ncbi:MAG: hypothetical protein OEV44_14300 [Spirochaetota bacterium]|nr:hypothetical protein [Spirochaetota bacterium]
MAKKYFFLPVLILTSAYFLYSDNKNEINEIKSFYYKVNKQIKKKQLANIKVKVEKTGVPAVGSTGKMANFYWHTVYQSVPDDTYGTDKLVKVNVLNQIAAHTWNIEYLYNSKGELIFYYISNSSNDSGIDFSGGELRLYFSQKHLIRVMEGNKISDNLSGKYKKITSKVLQESELLNNFFKYMLRNE